MQYFGIWSVFTWKTIPPPQLYKSKVKVKMAATYSEEKKDLDLVHFLFCCSSKRCDCVQKDWNSEQLAIEYVCMVHLSTTCCHMAHMPNQSAFSVLISNSSLRTSVSLTQMRAVVWCDLAILNHHYGSPDTVTCASDKKQVPFEGKSIPWSSDTPVPKIWSSNSWRSKMLSWW
jgi:hypothetical protein